MITIKIKTPKDYWEQLKEWVKEPRQSQCKEMVDYHHALIDSLLSEECVLSYLSKEDKEHVIIDIVALSNECRKSVNKLIQDCYPKFNIP